MEPADFEALPEEDKHRMSTMIDQLQVRDRFVALLCGLFWSRRFFLFFISGVMVDVFLFASVVVTRVKDAIQA
jgi:hypothetical protein